MKLFTFLFLALQLTSFKYSDFVILGDSYSTFTGYVSPDTNALWYPNPQNDVKEVIQMWWYLFEEETGCKLLKNNAFSGSTICYDGYGEGTVDSRELSFLSRSSDLPSSQLIIVEGATNDSWSGSAIGEYKYSEWTEKDKETFRPALACLLSELKAAHPESRIIFMLNSELKKEIDTSVEIICAHYDIDVLKLEGISKSAGHPNQKGMRKISEQLIDFIR